MQSIRPGLGRSRRIQIPCRMPRKPAIPKGPDPGRPGPHDRRRRHRGRPRGPTRRRCRTRGPRSGPFLRPRAAPFPRGEGRSGPAANWEPASGRFERPWPRRGHPAGPPGAAPGAGRAAKGGARVECHMMVRITRIFRGSMSFDRFWSYLPPPGKLSPDDFGRTRTPDNLGRAEPPNNFPGGGMQIALFMIKPTMSNSDRRRAPILRWDVGGRRGPAVDGEVVRRRGRRLAAGPRGGGVGGGCSALRRKSAQRHSGPPCAPTRPAGYLIQRF